MGDVGGRRLIENEGRKCGFLAFIPPSHQTLMSGILNPETAELAFPTSRSSLLRVRAIYELSQQITGQDQVR